MKKFNDKAYINDIQQAPFGVAEMFDDIDDKVWFFEKLFHDVIELHAPTKIKKVKINQVPFMHGELRRAINVKAMLKRKFYRSRCSYTWTKYKNQRNYVTKLKRKAKQEYFNSHCNKIVKNNDKSFWKTVKPFFTNNSSMSNISISHNDSIISEPNKVCDILNDFFIDVADSLGEPSDLSRMSIDQLRNHFTSHQSIEFIRSTFNNLLPNFSFQNVTSETVVKKCLSLKTGKAPGYDRIPSSFVRLASKELSPHLTKLINQSLDDSIFPHSLKKAIVTPVHKKKDPLNKSNYRPVSVLSGISKIFESVICDQMSLYFDSLLSPSLAAYRKNYSCEDVLLRSMEDWRDALDNDNFIGCVSMDLSKAFDSLPHSLLLTKLHAYGMSKSSIMLIKSYLSERLQSVKIGCHNGHWKSIKRGVPQG